MVENHVTMALDKRNTLLEKPGVPDLWGHQGTFELAFSKQNQHVETAIKSLDNLNDQIVQFIYSPPPRVKSNKKPGDLDLSTKDHERLRTSMSMMRHLLVDAQTKFRKMVEENKRLASRIDGSIHAANQEVKLIRDQLQDTNRRLTQLGSTTPDPGGQGSTPQQGPDVVTDSTNKISLEKQEKEEISQLREENGRLQKIIEDLNSELCKLRDAQNTKEDEAMDDKEEEDIVPESGSIVSSGLSPIATSPSPIATSPTALVTSLTPVATSPTPESQQRLSAKYNDQFRELQQQMVQAHQELSRAKEALLAMKTDRKRLQSEKLDLLSQLRQLYCTLEDKDTEIRDFIRKFEQQMRESNDNIKQLVADKEDCEREKWEILCKAQETSDVCTALRKELQDKDRAIVNLEARLAEAQEQIRNYENQIKNCSISMDSSEMVPPSSASSCRLKSSSVSVDSVLKSTSMDSQSPSSEELPPYQEIVTNGDSVNNKSIRSESSQSSFGVTNLTQSMDNIRPVAESSRSSDDMTSNIYVSIPGEIKTFIDLKTIQKKRRQNTSAFSRLFGGKSRSRKSIAVSDPSILEDPPEELSPRLSMLSEDNFSAKLDALKQARELGVTKWRAGHVLSWLEIEMNMPMYGKACAENIKSGKVLLGLSDSELDSALGLDSPLHRRKLRLAIEELRDPSTIRFVHASQMDHTWIAHRWLADLGLPQYANSFEAQLVDGRLLNVLTKKDLERHLGVQRRFHQNSILYGIELLRRLKYSKEELLQRRSQCELTNTDPLVWTNHRLLLWLQSIDLHEYVKALHESGIHGAVLILENAFNAEAFASALNIPATKSYVRRHLASELDSLVRPARAAIDGYSKRSRSASASLNRSFVRSYRGGTVSEDAQRGSSKRLSFRGSLGRALGRKSRADTTNKKEDEGDNESETGTSVSSSVSTPKRHSMEVQGTSV